MKPFGQDYNTLKCSICGNTYFAEYYKQDTPCPACQLAEREKQFQQTLNNQPLNTPSSFYFNDFRHYFD